MGKAVVRNVAESITDLSAPISDFICARRNMAASDPAAAAASELKSSSRVSRQRAARGIFATTFLGARLREVVLLNGPASSGEAG